MLATYLQRLTEIAGLMDVQPDAVLCVIGTSSVADPERCRELLRGAGFDEIEVRAQLEGPQHVPVIYAVGWTRSS